MPVKDTFSDWVDAYIRSGHVPYQVDEDLYEKIHENLEEEGSLLQIRPFPENNGMEASEELLQALHDLRSKLTIINTSKRLSFEVWFNEGTIQFYFYAQDEQQKDKIRRQIDAHYPNAEIVEANHQFPTVYQDDWVAGSELELKQSAYYPIKNPRGVRQFQSDPYRSITSDLLSADTDRIVIQVSMKPAMRTWTHGGKLGYINPFNEDIYEVADDLKGEQKIPDGSYKKHRSATSEERQLAENIARQEGLPAYHTNIRIFSFSPEKETAKSNVWAIGQTYEQSFQEAGGQQFLQYPLGGNELKRMLKEAARRDVVDQDMILTIPELATVAHIPNDSIETPSVEWNQTQATSRIPADAERFGVEDEDHQAFTPSDLEQSDEPDNEEYTNEEFEAIFQDEEPQEVEQAEQFDEGAGAEHPDPFVDEPAEPETFDEGSTDPHPDPFADEPAEPETFDNQPANDPQMPDQHDSNDSPDRHPHGGGTNQPQNQPAQNNQGHQTSSDRQQPNQRNEFGDGNRSSGEDTGRPEPPTSDEGGIIAKLKRLAGFEGNRGFQGADGGDDEKQPHHNQQQGGQQFGHPDNRPPNQGQQNGHGQHQGGQQGRQQGGHPDQQQGGHQGRQQGGFPDQGHSQGQGQPRQQGGNRPQQNHQQQGGGKNGGNGQGQGTQRGPADPSERPSNTRQPPEHHEHQAKTAGGNRERPADGYPDEDGGSSRTPQSESYEEDIRHSLSEEHADHDEPWVDDPDEEPTIEDVHEEFEDEFNAEQDAWDFDPGMRDGDDDDDDGYPDSTSKH